MFFFLHYRSDILLLVERNATHFWTSMYPAVLLNSFIRSSSFSVESLGFSMHRIILSASSDTLTSCFPIWMPFISIYFLIAVARTSILCWIKVVRVDILDLLQILVGKLSAFHCLVLFWLWVCQKWLFLYWDVFWLCPVW